MRQLIDKPSPTYIRRILRCDDRGHLFWRQRGDRDASWNTRYAGKPAGTKSIPNKNGTYRRLEVNIDRKRIKTHHIIWLFNTGDWPIQELDHIDRNPLNNCYSNLRLSPTKKQGAKRNLQSNNKTGVAGVYFVKRLERYAAKIQRDGKNKFLGYGTLEECTELRKIAELKR